MSHEPETTATGTDAGAPLFEIDDLHVAPAADPDAEILKGVSLTVGRGEVHALMGPNGSGKSTLASTLMGSPEYVTSSGTVRFKGEDITEWTADVRGKSGIFLAFQYPQEIPGVSVRQFLRQALSERTGVDLSVLEIRLAMMEWMQRLDMDPAFADRFLNEGFSGGEKKRNEVLQMAMLEPELAILDETDSGLDIDALARRGRRASTRYAPIGPSSVCWSSPTTSDSWTTSPPTWCTSSSTAASSTPVDRSSPSAWRPRGSTHGSAGPAPLDVASIKDDFPILSRRIHDQRLVFLDSAASSQKPRQVLDAMDHYYETSHANVHRAAYTLAEEATNAMEGARQGRPLRRRGPERGDRVHQERDRVDQPGRTLVGRGEPRPRRLDPAEPARAPRQHRAVAAARGREGLRDPVDPPHARRQARPGRHRSSGRRHLSC